jgi:hypothetical protein
VWQRYWDGRGRDFLMLGVAQDAQGAERVAPVVRERGSTFPVLVDRTGELARALSLRLVPAGAFVEDGIVRLAQREGFELGDPRLLANLEAFLAGRPVEAVDDAAPIEAQALERFGEGVHAHAAGDRDRAVALWRAALEIDPANFLIRSQLWLEEHPDRFGTDIDLDWQALQLARDGYEGPMP